jgi:hypothetical protein
VLRGALMARGHFVSQTLAPVIYNLAIIAGGLAIGTRIGAEGSRGARSWARFGRVRHRVARDPPRAGDPTVCAVRPARPALRGYLARCCRSWPASRSAPRTTGSDVVRRLLGAGAIASLGYARQLMLLPVGSSASRSRPRRCRRSPTRSEGQDRELHATLLGALRAGLSLACLAAGRVVRVRARDS